MMKERATYRIAVTAAITLSLVAVLPACAPKKIKTISPEHASALRTRLFPFGLYKHDVGLVISKGPDAKPIDMTFNGIVRLRPAQVQMVALSHFGTTVFKLNEDLKSGEVKTEVFVDEMKKFESKLSEYYSVLRLLLLAPYPTDPKDNRLRWTKTDPSGVPIEAETTGLEKNAAFHFVKYDRNNIPAEVVVSHPNYTVTVKVTDYEL